MKIDPKTTAPEAWVWDRWTKSADGNFHYLGRGTHAELAKYDGVCEANRYGMGVLVLDTDKPPPAEPLQVVVLAS